MRTHGQAGSLRVRVFAGTRVVIFGMDVDEAARPGLLGFAIYARDKTTGREHWLENLRIFAPPSGVAMPAVAPKLAAHAAAMLWGAEPVAGPEVGAIYSTADNPIQAFRWGHFGAEPGHEYTYRVVAMYGAPGALEPRDAVELDVTTESSEAGTHGVYFNRGVIASQAYTQLFQNRTPDEVPDRAAYKWLSYGLEEALLAFIAQADGSDAGLRAALYELDYAPALAAFSAASARGAQVQIVYDAKSSAPGHAQANLRAIQAAGIEALTIPRRANPSYIAHNKFIVLTRSGRPVEVWTGSTNLTKSGLFGQSNVGHVVRDEGVAAKYLAYWEQLAKDPMARALRAFDEASTPLDPAAPLFPVFSPRGSLGALESYAAMLSGAQNTAFLTAAFGVNKLLLGALEGRPAVLRYVLLERDGGDVVLIERSPDNQVAVGASIDATMGQWAAELRPSASGLDTHVFFIHDKFLLVDALTSSPTVITGSANFSDASTQKNDENTLVIRGDTRVADMYLTEFLRLFMHYRFRARLQGLGSGAEGGQLDQLSYLDPTDAWTAPAYAPDSHEARERIAFSRSDL